MKIALRVMLILTVGGAPLRSQTASQPHESHKYRAILTAGGAGGGFTLGIFGGIAAFDDATYATRKVWTTALISAAAGGVAGYFIGRALDKSASRRSAPPKAIPLISDALERSLVQANLKRLRGDRAMVLELGLESKGGEDLLYHLGSREGRQGHARDQFQIQFAADALVDHRGLRPGIEDEIHLQAFLPEGAQVPGWGSCECRSCRLSSSAQNHFTRRAELTLGGIHVFPAAAGFVCREFIGCSGQELLAGFCGILP